MGTFAVGITGAAVLTRIGGADLTHTQLGLCLAGILFVAGLGSGGVVTPNQALSLAEVRVFGGSTAGGMLQTAQRVGAAVGAAALSAVFYGRLGQLGPGSDAQRAGHYADAYSTALIVTVAMTLLAMAMAMAMALAIRERRRARVGLDR